jgi:hypothetical protein
VDLFFKIISNELETLESGIRVENEWLKFYLLISIYDKPAKATMLNMKGSTGYFGCTQCEIEGESIQFQNGNHLIFKYTSKANLRTEQSYKDSLANLNNGVLGECILSKLRFYHPIKSNQIDVMHSICLGICKLFFVYWFNSCLVKSYCLKNHMDILNSKLKTMRPPNFIAQAPRRLDDFKNWRAHEFLYFYLYFCLPLFYGIMPDVYFQNIVLFVISLEILLSREITLNKLKEAEKALEIFVSQLEILYDEHIMVSGTHEVLHLVQCTREIGPLKFNLFPFEELNRNITRLIHGMDLVGDEFITKWTVNKNLSLMIHKKYVHNNKYYDFIRKTFSIKSSNLKKKSSSVYNLEFCNQLKEKNTNLIEIKILRKCQSPNYQMNSYETQHSSSSVNFHCQQHQPLLQSLSTHLSLPQPLNHKSSPNHHPKNRN